ncbi:hypothetical protein, partial [Streptomyces huasconensis]|uniref:hypothetical protein n=1 Tax=Streptomyces huasconensis TaxID=1854574 RepID=UPI0033C4D0B3
HITQAVPAVIVMTIVMVTKIDWSGTISLAPAVSPPPPTAPAAGPPTGRTATERAVRELMSVSG